jgi:circadian clock protein KaiC
MDNDIKKKQVSKEDEKEEKPSPKGIGLKVPTGISDFDDLVAGGYRMHSINLLVGGSGAGKSIFSIQFLLEGIKRGENALYITFEEKKEEFYTNLSEFGFNLEGLEKEGKFFFLEYTPEKVKTMLEEGGGLIETVVLTKKIKRIVIDSITSLMLLFDNDLEKREAALELFTLLRKWECTTLLTYEGNPLEGRVTASSRVVDFESDSITLLYFVRGQKKRLRFLEILKMRGVNHSLSIHPYEIGTKGFRVSKETYEGKLPALIE